MFAVTVIFRIKPTDFETFLPLMLQNAASSLASEPGCRVFDVCTDPSRPNEVFLYELYDTETEFGAHLRSAHFLAFDAEVSTMVLEKTVATYSEVTR